jgi:hypothetical protein
MTPIANTNAHKLTPPKATTTALTEAQLNTQLTTKATIIQYARDMFNARLSINMLKADMIKAYLNLVTNRGMPGTTPTTTSNNSQTGQTTSKNPCPQQCQVTSDWNI